MESLKAFKLQTRHTAPALPVLLLTPFVFSVEHEKVVQLIVVPPIDVLSGRYSASTWPKNRMSVRISAFSIP